MFPFTCQCIHSLASVLTHLPLHLFTYLHVCVCLLIPCWFNCNYARPFPIQSWFFFNCPSCCWWKFLQRVVIHITNLLWRCKLQKNVQRFYIYSLLVLLMCSLICLHCRISICTEHMDGWWHTLLLIGCLGSAMCVHMHAYVTRRITWYLRQHPWACSGESSNSG